MPVMQLDRRKQVGNNLVVLALCEKVQCGGPGVGKNRFGVLGRMDG